MQAAVWVGGILHTSQEDRVGAAAVALLIVCVGLLLNPREQGSAPVPADVVPDDVPIAPHRNPSYLADAAAPERSGDSGPAVASSASNIHEANSSDLDSNVEGLDPIALQKRRELEEWLVEAVPAFAGVLTINDLTVAPARREGESEWERKRREEMDREWLRKRDEIDDRVLRAWDELDRIFPGSVIRTEYPSPPGIPPAFGRDYSA